MTRLTAIFCFCLLACGAALAQQDAAVFTPPQAYPVDRYEAGWGRNPFTLKTAPVIVENASFAKDLAIVGISGDTANPTVTVVNIKTHERFRLKLGQPGANGMLLNDVKRAESRKDSVVEVTLGSETSKLHYDNSYLKQVAATSTAKAAPQGSPQALQQLRQPPVQPGMPRPQIPGQPPQNLRLPTPPQQPAGGGFTASTGTAAVPPALQGIVPAFAFAQGNSQGDLAGTTVPTLTPNTVGGMNLSVSTGTPTGGQGVTNPAQATPTSQVANAAPVPVRRRMITPVNNVPPVQQ
jgi:hypothetical protein